MKPYSFQYVSFFNCWFKKLIPREIPPPKIRGNFARDSLKMAADCVCVALIHSRVSQCRIFGYFPQCQVNSV